ncbi:hypothetical protein GMD27_07055 [Parasutterella excrementihominis]|uniref:Uncharacterized protein n=1 Tax=Parasutterella excrementihominis TaxID=487175 RepID=A0A6I3S281_9BURK|nr:hypothetical protein [Parasutterella excrementihominis]MTT73627.1 hypothetical protein [Parasutterella excrementihominis]MTT96887.1 hypothetical protein [Parasutterella excrementihominis]MTU01511.1 hypothetical protein [Parasutterella excrementihominis]MTU06464.1 hypothetical protein [Parasutterella excrementihominis]MTU11539.1 hypothetical protein [Parasutterella excrementihominis]
MRGRRKQQWTAVLLLMTIQPEAWSSTEARFAKPIAEERVVIRVMGTKEIAAQEVSGELEKKETNREDKAEMESGKEPKGSR